MSDAPAPVRLGDLAVPAPRSRRAVVTLAAGPAGAELLAVSGPVLAAYARRVGADYVPLTPAEKGPYPHAYKFGLGRLLDAWDRVAFFDADVVLGPGCPDLFGVVPETHLGVHDDLPAVRDRGWLDAEYAALIGLQGWGGLVPPAACWNTGVVVASRRHRPAFDRPPRPFWSSPTAEQTLIGLNVARYGVPVFDLPRPLNYQWWADRDMRGPAHVWHYASCPAADRPRLMRAKAAALYGRAPRVALPLRPPCRWQGALQSECTTCGSERRHVYFCDHPDREYDRCTRGNPDSGFQTCAACPDHEPAGAGVPGVGPGPTPPGAAAGGAV